MNEKLQTAAAKTNNTKRASLIQFFGNRHFVSYFKLLYRHEFGWKYFFFYRVKKLYDFKTTDGQHSTRKWRIKTYIFNRNPLLCQALFRSCIYILDFFLSAWVMASWKKASAENACVPSSFHDSSTFIIVAGKNMVKMEKNRLRYECTIPCLWDCWYVRLCISRHNNKRHGDSILELLQRRA